MLNYLYLLFVVLAVGIWVLVSRLRVRAPVAARVLSSILVAAGVVAFLFGP